MRFSVVILMTALALATAGLACQATSPEAAPNGPTEIKGINWQLVEVGGRPAEPVPADDHPANFRLDAASEQVSGYGGVNRLTGRYELNKKRLKFGTLAMTGRAGPAPLMLQEHKLSRAMKQTASWRSAGQDEIELLDAADKPLARFARAAE